MSPPPSIKNQIAHLNRTLLRSNRKLFSRSMGWCDLPADVLQLIAARITLHADYIRFRAVCSSWRSAVSSRPCHLPPQLPFLMLPARDDPSGGSGARNFYSLTEHRTYRLEFPTHKHCLGSSYGWLVLLGPSTALSLLNPFTGSQLRLPPATQIPHLSDTVTAADVKSRLSEFSGERAKSTSAGFWQHLIRKAKLCRQRSSSSSSSSKEQCVVVVAFPKAGLAFWQRGRKAWTHAGRYWQFVDVEFYKGKLYAITRGGILSTIEIDTSVKETVIISSPPFSYNGSSSVYLAESAEGLLLVVRKHGDDGGAGSIGDRILIVERGTSMSLPASGLAGCKGNRIYFTDEYDVCSEGQITGGLDFGVFCLEDGSVQRLPCYPQDAESLWPFPSWEPITLAFTKGQCEVGSNGSLLGLTIGP
uniref:F-box domain-containing protein n=1 Tax=Ananas comosus var. bracteatus TaxID=296719 RepID=A0A6V7Q5W7_ANACO|nr:unnamed protein product [Ananas comosus var. bracteatus]